MPVSFLTDNERERLQCFPAEISLSDLTAFFTLSITDMALVQKQRGDHNRLGFSLQLCTLRYLGFSPNDISTISDDVVSYVSKQLRVEPSCLKLYGERMQTQSDHLQEIQDYLGFHISSTLELEKHSRWLLERALEHDKPSLLLQLSCEKFYQEKIVRPGITRLEKMVATARSQAQEETYKRLSPLLTFEQKTFLDGLLVSDATTHRSHMGWLSKGATSNSASAMIACLQKLEFLRKHNVDQWDMSLLTPNRLKFLAHIAKRSTNQALQRMPEQRRYPVLLSFLNQSLIGITDETIEIYDRCLWDCYTGARHDLEAFKKEVYQSSNEKVRLLKELGRFVLDSEIKDQELRETIFAYLPPEKLQAVIEECAKIIRPSNDKYFDFFSTRYSYLRQFVPQFVSSFVFKSNTKDDVLLAAIDTLRQINASKHRKLPPDVPLDCVGVKG